LEISVFFKPLKALEPSLSFLLRKDFLDGLGVGGFTRLDSAEEVGECRTVRCGDEEGDDGRDED
jgi:hypothetical protein